MLIKIPKPWEMPERLATPESVYCNRRTLLRGMATTALLTAGGAMGGAQSPDSLPRVIGPSPPGKKGLYPARGNPRYTLDRPLTDEATAAHFNVFDEFSVDHSEVWEKVSGFETDPWTIHVGGLVEKPLRLDLEELTKVLGLEERLYRHRCVETWAMAVPWTGIPFKDFVDYVKPTSKARYVRMVSFARPEQAPGWYSTRRVFPYYEALSIEEATNELAFLATGIYGHPLPAQHGAPLRLAVPWKWGLKSIKSIVAFQFTIAQPGTLWNDLSPGNYSFECNVDPVDFPGSWSQEEETMLGTGETRRTMPFNGYAEQVAHLYTPK